MDEVMLNLEEKEEVWAAQVRATLSRRQNFHSLRYLSIKSVAEAMLIYANCGMTNIFKVLPSTLCNEIFINFVSFVNKKHPFGIRHSLDYLKVAYLFVDARLQTFDDNILCNYCSEEEKQGVQQCQETFLVHVVREVKHLKSLAVHDQRNWNSIFSSTSLKPFVSSLVKMKIQNFTIKNEHLPIIAETCASLQFLEMILSRVTTENDLASLTRLSGLQYLLFEVEMRYGSRDAAVQHLRIGKFFLKEMPHLKLNGNFYNKGTWKYFPKHTFRHLEGPTEVALREVNLKADQIVPTFVSLPHVISLNICADNLQEVYNLEALPEFPKLTLLSLANVNLHQMNTLLEKYGKQLQNLNLKFHAEDTCNLVKILKLCPNMENLLIEAVDVKINNPTQLSKNCFSKLKNVDIFHDSQNLSSNGLVHMLFLHAPNLETIDLLDCNIEINEISKITTDLKSGRASGHNLSVLTLAFNILVNDDDGKELFLNFVYQLFASCTKLSLVYFLHTSQPQAFETLLVKLKAILETFIVNKPISIDVC